MDNAVLFIGGSELQLPAIRLAKEAGLRVLLSDTNSNPIALPYADCFAQISGDDSASLAQYALEQSNHFKIQSAYCGSDFGIKSVSYVNQALGLPALSLASIDIIMDKYKANSILRDSGISVPAGFMLQDNESPPLDIKFPVIVKPTQGSGSRGVTFVESRSFLYPAIKLARSISSEILIEEFVIGKHIDVSGFFASGQFFPGGQLDRYFSPLPNRFPIWGCQPPSLSYDLQGIIYTLLEHSCRVLNMDWGPVKGDIIISNNGPVLIELTPRFHGDVSTSFVCPLAYGYSPVEHWMNWLSNSELPNTQNFQTSAACAGWAGIFPPQLGTLESIAGVTEAEALPGISQVILRRSPGWKVHHLDDNRSVIGFVVATGQSSFEVRTRLTEALEIISVIMSDADS